MQLIGKVASSDHRRERPASRGRCVPVCLRRALTHCYTPIFEMRRATPACQRADTPDGHLTVTVGHSVSARAARETQHASATLTLARQNANGAARRQSARHHAHRITRAGRRANTHAHSQCDEVDAHGDSKINVAAQDKKKDQRGKILQQVKIHPIFFHNLSSHFRVPAVYQSPGATQSSK